MRLPKFTFGVGDRFAHEGAAQLNAVLKARELGVRLAPVWNKSPLEHRLIGTGPRDVRAEADAAAQLCHYDRTYFVDADQVTFDEVDDYIGPCNYFTLDVSGRIGERPDADGVAQLLAWCEPYLGEVNLPGIDEPLTIERDQLAATAEAYLPAIEEAGRICRHIAASKGEDLFVTEVSLSRSDQPQTPAELLVILAAIAQQQIPAATIAPRLPGRFLKGIDYIGDIEQFATEFEQHVAVVAFATAEFGLPEGMKLSIHSAGDKFAVFPVMHDVLKRHEAGIHVKTSGTTWLEELTGLAEAGGEGLAVVKRIYRAAVGRIDELCAPYASELELDRDALPPADTVDAHSGAQLAAMLRHDVDNPMFNPNVRQLLHVAYKVAAEMDRAFLAAVADHHEVIARNVTENLLDRHIRPLLLGR